ncbi:MAG: cytochrome c biogenesis protein ResB [Verrucomicrobia bacterium]|nr:cytochrome c biogenesis protein ResB [Verrucomicrobiota bacterium]
MLDRIVRTFASLKLAVVCLALAVLLVFFGTIFQVDEGLYNVQARYFRSLLIYWSPQGASWKIPVFPGGYLIGAVLLINLVTSFAERVRQVRGRVGLLMTHAGMILLVVGQFATDLLSVESHMRLVQGEPKNFSEAGRDSELAIIETTDKDSDQVFPVPERWLARENEIKLPELPFVVRVKKYYENSSLARRGSEEKSLPPAATQGLGPEISLQPAPPVVKMDERNLPAAVLELVTLKGSLGTWLVALGLDQLQPVTVEGRTFTLQLRSTRYYKPYSLTLLKFTFDKYPGSEIPKNFASRVRLERPDPGESREALIYMNSPLRYAGETYYQSGYDEQDPRVTILQVVRNPSWLTPYFSCLLVGLGLSIHFLSQLFGFVKQRRTA